MCLPNVSFEIFSDVFQKNYYNNILKILWTEREIWASPPEVTKKLLSNAFLEIESR